MAAPERFAEKSDSSCTAGTVHTWPLSTFAAAHQFGSDRSNSGHSGRSLETALLTPTRKWSVHRSNQDNLGAVATFRHPLPSEAGYAIVALDAIP